MFTFHVAPARDASGCRTTNSPVRSECPAAAAKLWSADDSRRRWRPTIGIGHRSTRSRCRCSCLARLAAPVSGPAARPRLTVRIEDPPGRAGRPDWQLISRPRPDEWATCANATNLATTAHRLDSTYADLLREQFRPTIATDHRLKTMSAAP